MTDAAFIEQERPRRTVSAGVEMTIASLSPSAGTTSTSGPTLPNRKPWTRSTLPGQRQMRANALFGVGKPSVEKLTAKKNELLQYVSSLDRGAAASSDDKQRVEELVQGLERLNPTKKPLGSPLVDGQWELIYTTSSSILGTKRPPFLRPQGPIYQLIDAKNLKAANRETWPFFNQVSADLTPSSDSEVAVRFRQFKVLGLIPVTAPESATGSLAITYLDEQMRISRGDRGNLFILLMDDRSKQP